MTNTHLFPAVLVRNGTTRIAKSSYGVLNAEAWGEVWQFVDALHEACHLIHDDETLGSEDRRRLLLESLTEFNCCMASAMGLVDLNDAADIVAQVQAFVMEDLDAQIAAERAARPDPWDMY